MVFAYRGSLVNSGGIAFVAAGFSCYRFGGRPHDDPEVLAPAAVFGASAGAALYRRAALMDVAEPEPGPAVGDAPRVFGPAVGDDARSFDRAVGDGPRSLDRAVRDGPRVFDPAFFMYLEDVDLAWRLQWRGWRCAYAPGATVSHIGSATSGEGSAFKNWHLGRNKIWLLAKNYPTVPLARRFPLLLLYDLASAPYRLLAEGETAALRGRLAAWLRMGAVLRQRRRILERRVVEWDAIEPLIEPFASPRRVLARYRHLQRSSGGPPRPT
jgi:cellulose synthase/poly-beta-1,6-N-acetylglucosamine synthase-like glycosyltransferase